MIPPELGYSAALMVAGLLCLTATWIIAQTRRHAAGAIPLMVLMLGLAWWDLAYSLFWAATPGPYPNFWLYITYVGVVTVPTAFLVFAMQVTGMEDWLKPGFVTGLCIVPVLVIVMLYTDPWHGLFFAGKQTENMGVILDAGPVFWANIIYSYLLILIGFVLLIRRYRQTSGIYRQQIAVILIGVGFPWLNSFIFIFGLSPFENADNTPFSFTFAGIAYTYALLRFRLLDVLPIARHVLIENMTEGVIVLDAHNRLVDINPAAKQVLGSAGNVKLGEPIEKVFSEWSSLVEQYYNVRDARAEVPIGDPPHGYLDLKISSLHDDQHNFIGRLIVWRDITELKMTQSELREIATKDGLTQALNRGHFFELFRRELNHSIHHGGTLAVIVLDLDQFKQVNDTFGHLAGDEFLTSFAAICRRNIRGVDLFARFGGDEFIILLPNADLQRAQQVSDRLLRALAEAPVKIGDQEISITVSIGISGLVSDQDTAESIVQRADRALYNSKSSGRNRITIWDDPSAVDHRNG